MSEEHPDQEANKPRMDLAVKRKNLEVQTHHFGLIKIRRISVKDHFHIPAILEIEDAKEFSQTFVFNQIFESPLSFEDFKKISDDELKEIIRKIVANETGLKKFFIEKEDDDFFGNFRSSVKKYYDESDRKMRESLAPFISSFQEVQKHFLQNFKPIIAPIQNSIPIFSIPVPQNFFNSPQISPLLDFTKIIQNQYLFNTEVIEKIWTPKIYGMQSFFNQNQKIFGNFLKSYEKFQETLKKIKISIDQANSILKKYKWFLSPSLPDELIIEILKIHRSRKKGRQKKINRLFIGHFSHNNYEELRSMVESWNDNPLFKPRMKIFRDCVKTLQNSKGKYNPSNVVLPTLIAQIDGLLTEYVKMKGITTDGRKWKDSSGKSLRNREEGYKLLPSSQAYLSELPNYIILEILFQTAWPGQELNIPSTFSRHKIMHGEYTNYGRIENTIRAFMILDFLNYLE